MTSSSSSAPPTGPRSVQLFPLLSDDPQAYSFQSVNANHFYQEYIAKKDHIHMNATHWHSLTEFVKFLGREGICKVSVDEEKGTMEIAWIDNSPENLRRQDALRKKERQDKGDEERERMLIAEQVERARRDAEGRQGAEEDVVDEERTALQREDGQRIKLNFGSKRKEQEPSHTSKVKQEEAPSIAPGEEVGVDTEDSEVVKENTEDSALSTLDPSQGDGTPAPDEKPSVSVSLSGNKPKNVFAAAKKKNALGGGKSTPKPAPQKPMSEAERIMREELERKRRRESMGFGSGGKKLKV